MMSQPWIKKPNKQTNLQQKLIKIKMASQKRRKLVKTELGLNIFFSIDLKVKNRIKTNAKDNWLIFIVLKYCRG